METPKVKVTIKKIPVSSRKLRLVADMVRGMKVNDATNALGLLNKKGAAYLLKALNSAISNGETVYGYSKDSMVIDHISVDEDAKRRKYKIASRSRVAVLTKQYSKINIELNNK